MIRTRWRYPVERTLFEILLFIIVRRGRRLDVEGVRNVPRRGAAILVCNHVATIDPPMIGARVRRLDVHYMAKREAFARPFNRFFLVGWNAFPVVRHSADRAALAHSLEILRQGHVLVLFPEGSRSEDGRMTRGFPGTGFIARHSGAPVIPVAIWGSERVLPKGSQWPHAARVHIRFGAPVTFPLRDRDGRAVRNQEVTDRVMARIAEMLPEPYRGVYDGRPLERRGPRDA